MEEVVSTADSHAQGHTCQASPGQAADSYQHQEAQEEAQAQEIL